MLRMHNSELDGEWVNLMLVARELGLSKEEIREFLKKNQLPEKVNTPT